MEVSLLRAQVDPIDSDISLDSQGREIWTSDNYDWAWCDPFASAFTQGNDFVTEQWSVEFAVASKKNAGLTGASFRNFASSMYYGQGSDASKHLANGLMLLGMGFVNIEIANFIKGVIGTLISTVKLPVHMVASVAYFLGTLACALNSNPDEATEYLNEALSNLGFSAKDIISIISCLGHSIPSWLPTLILYTSPPTGTTLSIVKFLSKFTGIPDVAGYGGGALLLYAKTKIAQWDLAHSSSPQLKREATKTIEAWNHMKAELNPTQSYEGALLSLSSVHIICEVGTSLLKAFIPSLDSTIKYTAYAVQTLAAIILTSMVYKNKTAESPPIVPLNQVRLRKPHCIINWAKNFDLSENPPIWELRGHIKRYIMDKNLNLNKSAEKCLIFNLLNYFLIKKKQNQNSELTQRDLNFLTQVESASFHWLTGSHSFENPVQYDEPSYLDMLSNLESDDEIHLP